MKTSFLDIAINPFLSKNYHYAKAYNILKLYYADFIHNLNSHDQKIIVYTMGKVGSTTVEKSLKALKKLNVYHVHFLTPESVTKTEKVYQNSFVRRQKIATHIVQSLYLQKQLNTGLETNRWKIVTLVRDPIAKNISSFFQNLDLTLEYDYQEKIVSQTSTEIVEDLKEMFLNKYDEHDKPLTWLDRELKTVFNLDVFAQEFPQTQGYEIYHTKSTDTLLIKLENLNTCGEDAFKKFLNINDFTIVGANIGSKKDYGEIYRQFLNSIVLPKSYIDKMYTSKYMRHFYTEAEIEAFRAKWCRQNCTQN